MNSSKLLKELLGLSQLAKSEEKTPTRHLICDRLSGADTVIVSLYVHYMYMLDHYKIKVLDHEELLRDNKPKRE